MCIIVQPRHGAVQRLRNKLLEQVGRARLHVGTDVILFGPEFVGQLRFFVAAVECAQFISAEGLRIGRSHVAIPLRLELRLQPLQLIFDQFLRLRLPNRLDDAAKRGSARSNLIAQPTKAFAQVPVFDIRQGAVINL